MQHIRLPAGSAADAADTRRPQPPPRAVVPRLRLPNLSVSQLVLQVPTARPPASFTTLPPETRTRVRLVCACTPTANLVPTAALLRSAAPCGPVPERFQLRSPLFEIPLRRLRLLLLPLLVELVYPFRRRRRSPWPPLRGPFQKSTLRPPGCCWKTKPPRRACWSWFPRYLVLPPTKSRCMRRFGIWEGTRRVRQPSGRLAWTPAWT